MLSRFNRNLPRYKHYNDAGAPRHFWLWVRGVAFVLFFVIPFGRYWLGL